MIQLKRLFHCCVVAYYINFVTEVISQLLDAVCLNILAIFLVKSAVIRISLTNELLCTNINPINLSFFVVNNLKKSYFRPHYKSTFKPFELNLIKRTELKKCTEHGSITLRREWTKAYLTERFYHTCCDFYKTGLFITPLQ